MRTLAIAVLLASAPLAFAGGEPWADEQAFKLLLKEEVKVLEGLLETAVKKDYRRQAWYCADRIAAVAPGNAAATDVLDKWDAAELQAGEEPSKAYVKQRDGALRNLGDQYFHFGETLEASGMDPEKYYPISVRAHAYGSQAGPLVSSLKGAGYVKLGTYELKPRAEAEACLGAPVEEFRFPEEWDDGYLRARAVWPEARGAEWGRWRLVSDHQHKEALRLLGILRACDTWFARTLGSKAKRKGDVITDLLVFSEFQKYDKIGGDLVAERDKPHFEGTSGWYDLGAHRLMVCWRHRVNGWLGDDDLMLGHASRVMARRHLASGALGAVTGRGAWLLEGLRGAFEGFRLDQDGRGEIDPGSCWRLAVARALREDGKLVPWEEFHALDLAGIRGKERTDLKVGFGGAQRDGKQLDVVAAQATAVVVGLMKAKKGKGARKLGKALGTLIKTGHLDDIDKAMGLKAGTAEALANVAMDAAHGK